MDTLGLGLFKIPIDKIAPLQRWRDRTGFAMSYRLYPAWSENLVILFHGIGADSVYLAVLASAIASSGVASVVTPDLRCHGVSLGASDQLATQQLELDLEELYIHLRQQRDFQNVLLAGHSMGGAFAYRAAENVKLPGLMGGWGIVPFLPPELGWMQEDRGGWIAEEGEAYRVLMPKRFQTGREKLIYSKEYIQAVRMPEDYFRKPRRRPGWMTLAGKDPIYKNLEIKKFMELQKDLQSLWLEDANHFSVVMSAESIEPQLAMLRSIFYT